MTEQEIRQDWYKALSNKDKWGSGTIHWSFYSQDLLVLGCLHEAGLFQEEIEDLLEDCNFHTECKLLYEQDYAEYRRIVIRDMREEDV